MDGNQLLRQYLSGVERDVGTRAMSNHEITAYLTTAKFGLKVPHTNDW